MFVFGAVELFFEMYRKLSQFDQTSNLKHDYIFEDPNAKENEFMAETEYKKAEEAALV